MTTATITIATTAIHFTIRPRRGRNAAISCASVLMPFSSVISSSYDREKHALLRGEFLRHVRPDLAPEQLLEVEVEQSLFFRFLVLLLLHRPSRRRPGSICLPDGDYAGKGCHTESI